MVDVQHHARGGARATAISTSEAVALQDIEAHPRTNRSSPRAAASRRPVRIRPSNSVLAVSPVDPSRRDQKAEVAWVVGPGADRTTTRHKAPVPGHARSHNRPRSIGVVVRYLRRRTLGSTRSNAGGDRQKPAHSDFEAAGLGVGSPADRLQQLNRPDQQRHDDELSETTAAARPALPGHPVSQLPAPPVRSRRAGRAAIDVPRAS